MEMSSLSDELDRLRHKKHRKTLSNIKDSEEKVNTYFTRYNALYYICYCSMYKCITQKESVKTSMKYQVVVSYNIIYAMFV